jgi:hypothetical protein
MRYLGALFKEMNTTDRSTILFTLKDNDEGRYPSLYRLYMAESDPTEYSFATRYFESWHHWLELCECEWFKPYAARWRFEFETRLRAQSLARLLEAATGASKEAVQVNKWIVEGGYTPKGKQGSTGRGRPSKDDIAKEAHRIASGNTKLDEDYLRIVQ